MKSKIYEVQNSVIALFDKLRYILLVIFFVAGITARSQGTMNLIVFSEDGDLFYVFVNGVKQNKLAEANVKLLNQATTLNVKIEFENKTLKTLKQNMALDADREHLVKIIRNKNNQLKLRYNGSVALSETVNSGNTTYNTAEDAPANEHFGGPVNQVDPGSQTATPVESSAGSGKSTYTVYPPAVASRKYAMSESNFLRMKESVESKSFTDTKMSTAKTALQNTYVSVNQIKAIASLFNMDEDRLTYAKYAYDFCVDKANYYLVGDVFKFSFTVDELNAFIQRGSE